MHLKPVTYADLPDFSRTCGIAMWDDEVMQYTAPYKDQNPDSFFQYCLHRTQLRFTRGEFMFVCVTDEEDADWNGQDTVMGYCGYSTTVQSVKKSLPSGWLGNTFEQFAVALYARYTKLFRLDRSADRVGEAHFRQTVQAPVFERYLASLPEEQRDILGDQHWELEILGTHPDFRRRGVGKFMVEEGKRRARESGVPLLVIASVIGEHLYLSAGFREVNRIYMLPEDELAGDNLKDLGFGLGKGKGIAWAAMVWEPETMRGRLSELTTTLH